MAHGSEFYVPNIFRDRISLTAKVDPDISTWSEMELVDNKSGWEFLRIVSSSLLLGVCCDHYRDPFPLLHTMAGVEIDVDSDEFHEWCHLFTRFLPAAIFEAQHKISEIQQMLLGVK
jgi:hypothetical protein